MVGRRPAVVLAFASGVLFACAGLATQAAGSAGPGCGTAPAAIHRAGLAAKLPTGVPARVACQLELGAPITETTLTTDDRGVFVGLTAAGGSDILRTDDQGASWKRLAPAEGAARLPSAGMGWIVRDPDSGRLFASSLRDPTCANPIFSDVMSYSDDRGASWHVERGRFCDGGDWGKTFLGPPANAAQAQALKAAGYPNAVYHCMGATVQVTRQCWRSLDGGKSWQRTANPVSEYPTLGLGVTLAPYSGPPLLDTKRAFGECGLDGARFPDPHVLTGNGVVASDGTIFVPANACGDVVMAVSSDGGDTWHASEIPDALSRGWYPHGDGATGYVVPRNGGLPHAPGQAFRSIYGEAGMSALFSQQFAIDRNGVLYFAWIDARDDRPYLMVSRDRAKTWSKRSLISPPGLKWASTATVSVREPGHVAVAYFGTPGGTAYDGYLSETRDALAPAPTWQTMKVAGKGRPLEPNGIGEPTEYVGLGIAHDGTPWAVFPRDTCVYSASKPDPCDDFTNYDQSRYEGVVARMATPPVPRCRRTVAAPAAVSGRRIVSARAYAQGRSVLARRRAGRFRANLSLRGAGVHRVRVVLRVRTSDGHRHRLIRSVRSCVRSASRA
jgi:hypothetical protein